MNIIIALLVFTVIVVLHELGHFLLAKKNGVGVTEFSVGMGPRLITLVKTGGKFTVKLVPSQKYCEEREDWVGHTWYSWKLLPIGGSCAMVGEDEENDAKDSFQKATVWGKISIIAAGPIFNFISAFVFAVILIGFVGYNPAEVTDVDPNSAAAKAGIEKGDVVTSIDGDKIKIGMDYSVYFSIHDVGDEPLLVKYTKANGEEKEASVDPNYTYYRLGFSYEPYGEEATAYVSQVLEDGPLGKAGMKVGDVITSINGTEITGYEALAKYLSENPLTGKETKLTYERNGVESEISAQPVKATVKSLRLAMGKREHGNVLQIVRYGATEIRFWIETTIKSLGMLVRGKVSTDDMSGVVGIVDMIGDTVDASPTATDALLSLLNIAILLSANLGVMNLLPLPALDGGRLVFLFVELVRGKPADQKVEGMVHLVGIVLLMALMVFVTYNDIIKIVTR